MAKETKDLETTEKAKTKKKVSSSKQTSKKSTSSSKNAVAKKAAASSKKPSTKKKEPAKKTTTAKKATTTKKVATTKKADSKKSLSTKKATTVTKKTTTKKATTAKKTEKKSTSKKAASKKTEPSVSKTSTKKKTVSTKSKESKKTKEQKEQIKKYKSEYYDLPYMYNRTIVKVLAQTPKMLFIYWEVSEDDRDLFKKLYGENFFNHTKPVLIVYNDTMNYSFEVDVDDFANSWYLHINDANCEYHVELGRKPISNINHYDQPIYIPYYVYVTSSNEMTSPNNTIMFDPNLKTIRFRNVKTGEVIEKDIMNFTFITNIGIFNIKDLYKFLFPNESFEFENIVLGNTSSGALSSSGMFSSQIK